MIFTFPQVDSTFDAKKRSTDKIRLAVPKKDPFFGRAVEGSFLSRDIHGFPSSQKAYKFKFLFIVTILVLFAKSSRYWHWSRPPPGFFKNFQIV